MKSNDSNSKNATWRWQWAHLAICTWTSAVAAIVSHFPEPGGKNIKLNKWFLDSLKCVPANCLTCWNMNYYPVWIFYTDRQTYRQTERATHRSPTWKLHRWAQKVGVTRAHPSFGMTTTKTLTQRPVFSWHSSNAGDTQAEHTSRKAVCH